MTDTVELARREGVELVRTGSFQTLTGSWNPTPKDIAAAVDAMSCPAIRKPVIRLGHSDTRFVGDGEPALGWFENLRAADGGSTLVADQVTLPWLHSVQAAAYPSRSIEGNYRHRCSEGHIHPFVIHTVALLGVTPPGVSTLRSLNDLPEMLGVTASGEVPEGAERVQVTVLAANETHAEGFRIADITAAGSHSHFDPGQKRDGDGKWTDGTPGQADASAGETRPAKSRDKLKLAARIRLGEGESLQSSGRVGSDNQNDTVMAVIDTPTGKQLRLGIVDTQDRRSWSAADRGGTVQFDEDGIGRLWDGLEDMGKAGPEMLAKYRADVKDVTKRIKDGSASEGDYPNWDDITHDGTIAGSGWGDLVYRIGFLESDRELADGAPDVSWYADVAVRPKNAGSGWSFDDQVGDDLVASWKGPHIRKMLRELDALTVGEDGRGSVAASSPFPGRFRTRRADPVLEADVANSRDAPAEDAPPAGSPAPQLPAAEPEPVNPDPKEDPVSTDLSVFRSRLGLDDTADESAITAAIDALKTKADTPVEPTPEMVAASAATEAEKDELRKEVQVLASQVQSVTTELAATKAEKAATVKASVLGDAKRLGKFTPADEEQWSKDYDDAPGAVTRILASIAVGTAVPVQASGSIGTAEPLDDMSTFEADMARLDGPVARKAV